MNRLYPEINSNGNFPLEKIKLLKNIDYLKFSLDGEEEIHDEVRGKGSFKHVMDAVVAAANMGINFGFSCTLTKYNINNLGYLLKIAKKYNTIVGFQPLKLIYRGVRNIDFLAPTEYEHKKAIAGLIKEKLSGNRNIRNTLSGLKLIYTWPKYKKLKCWAGKIFCIIGSNGDLYSCDRISYNIHVSNIIKQGLKESLENLSEVHCRGCGFCGALELNYLMNFNFKTLASIQKIIK
jgi:MoaA/NifB/PqqE/SkfB family radical SAM enzyme